MFIDAIIGGISLLRYWQVWVAIIISSIAVFSPLIVIGGIYSKSKSAISIIISALIYFCGPILDAMVTGFIIMFLMPILFGINYTTPFPPIIKLSIYILIASCFAILTMLIITLLIARLTIFFTGTAYNISDNLFSILINLILFAMLIHGYIANIITNNNVSHIIYPGLVDAVIILLASWAFMKIIFILSILLSLIFPYDTFYSGLIIGSISRLLPIFMFAQYIALSSLNKVSSFTTPMNIALCFTSIYLIYGISRVWDDFAEPDSLNRKLYIKQNDYKIALLNVFLWPILISMDLNWFYQGLKQDLKQYGDNQGTKTASTSFIEQDTQANDNKYIDEYNQSIEDLFKRQSFKLLIVEDRRGIIDSYIEILKTNKIYPKFAYDIASALSALEEPIDLIIADIILVGMKDRYELLRILNDRYPNIPRAVVTAYASEESRKKALEYGVMAYISKPFAIEQIYALIVKAAKQLGKDLGPDYIFLSKILNILCIDSQVGVLESLKEILKIKKNLMVDILHTGDINEAISKLKDNDYDLIFIQLNPDRYGLKLLSYVKSHDLSTQVVIYSAYASEEFFEEAKKLGIFKWLRMPWLMGEIYTTVEEAAKKVGKDLGPDFIKHNTDESS